MKSQFTPRQLEMINLFMNYNSNKFINYSAEKLGVATITAKNMLYQIFRRIGVHNQNELRYYIKKNKIKYKM